MFEKDLYVGYLLDFYGDILTEHQREVMTQYYEDDLSLSEIAENTGISRQGVRAVVKKGESILRDMEDKLGLAARFRAMNAAADKLASELEELGGDDMTGFASRIRDIIK